MKYLSLLLIVILAFFSCTPKKESGTITAGKLNIFYERSGKGEPVLLLHAGFMDHTMWAKQVAFLEKKYSVITIDLPGSGNTTGKDTAMLISDVIRTCLDKLQVQKASVVGLSIGAACATEFALAYPDRINKLILVSPGLVGSPEVLQMDSISAHAIALSGAADSSKDNKRIAEVFTANWAVGPFRKPSEMDSSVRNFVYNHVTGTLEQHQNESWANFLQQPTAAKMLPSIRNKTLIIYADKDLPFIGNIATYIHRIVSGSGLVVFNNAAHMLNMEMPDRFNHVVDSFLVKQ